MFLNRKRLSKVGATIALAGFAVVGFAVTPAQATTYDASGVEFDFSNVNDILADAASGQSARYLNVATINGTQIDATVTVIETSNVVANLNFQAFGQSDVDFLGSPWTIGCYWNPTYDTTFDANDLNSSDKLDPEIAIVDYVNNDHIKAISTEISVCGGYNLTGDGYGTIQVEFTTGDSETPVTLNHLHISALDIDGGQYVNFHSPKPTSVNAYATTDLTITDNSDNFDVYGANGSVDSENQLKWVAEAEYGSVSSLQYDFGTRDSAGSAHLDMLFKSTAFSGDSAKKLANTGSASDLQLTVGATAIAAGLALSIASTRRRKARA